MKKNDEFIIDITDINEDGAGIGKYEGFVFFVPRTLPGDRVLAACTKLKKTYGYARLVEIVEASKDREKSSCEVAGRCGGCSLMHLSYEGELRLKEKKVWEVLTRIGGIPESVVKSCAEPIIGMESPLHYRNKAQYPVSTGKKGEILMGFFAPYSHRIVESKDCLIGNKKDSQILEIIRDWMGEFAINPYNEVTGKGLVRHILIRHGYYTNETMVCLVINDRDGSRWNRVNGREELIQRLTKIVEIKSICLNYNTTNGNVILGETSKCVWGRDYIQDKIKLFGDPQGLVFKISPASFYQVNPIQMSKLYERALEYAGVTGDEIVWDLYSGIGTITLSLATVSKKVLGVEVSSSAVRDARCNAAKNEIYNVDFFEGPTEEVLLSENLPEEMKKPDIIVMDPPRKGCDMDVLSAVLEANPTSIVYVSCNPATLARDLRVLIEGGYRLEKFTPVDQFPRTMHVETVCLLSNRKADSHIKLSLDMDEYYDIMDKEKAEKK